MNQTIEHSFLATKKESGRESLDINNPEFEKATKVHDWRNYVPQVAQNIWHELKLETKQMIYIMAQAQASNEEWD